MLGAFPIATRPITALQRRIVITQVFAVLATAGVGAFTPVLKANGNMSTSMAGVGSTSFTLSAQTRSSMSCAGAGAFAPVLRATASSQSTMQGSSTFGGADTASAAATIMGVGTFTAVSYAFFADAERACLHEELRAAAVEIEGRTAIVPFEDRIYRVAPEPRSAGNDPRKRIC